MQQMDGWVATSPEVLRRAWVTVELRFSTPSELPSGLCHQPNVQSIALSRHAFGVLGACHHTEFDWRL